MSRIKLILGLFISVLFVTSSAYAYGDKGTPCLDCHTVFAQTVLVGVSPTEVTAEAGGSIEFYATVTGSGYHKGYTQSVIAVPVGWVGGGEYVGYAQGEFLDGTPADNYYTELRSGSGDHYEEFYGIVTIPADAPEGDYTVEVLGAGCDADGVKASHMGTITVHVIAAPPILECGPADLVRRSAWPEHHHFDVSRGEDSLQTLYGKVKNIGTLETCAAVEFKIFDKETDSLVDTLVTETICIGPDAIVDLSADWAPPLGKYYVEATARHDSDGDGVPDAYGAKVKTFGFSVVP